MELQETLLHGKMDKSLAQEIKTMMLIQVTVVHSSTEVAGGIVHAMIQTSMVSTMVEHIHPRCGWCELVHMEETLLLPQIH